MKKILINLPSWAMFIILIIPFCFGNLISFGVIIAFVIFSLWLFIVGNSLEEKAKTYEPVSLKWFNTSLVYALIYTIILETMFVNPLPNYLIPFHLLAVFCIFSALFFVSKLLVISEEKKIVKANRCFGTFILFWFFPIGIWFVHPRIKKVLVE